MVYGVWVLCFGCAVCKGQCVDSSIVKLRVTILV